MSSDMAFAPQAANILPADKHVVSIMGLMSRSGLDSGTVSVVTSCLVGFAFLFFLRQEAGSTDE